LDLLTKSSTDRYVIYKLCDILNIKYERIELHSTRIFMCDKFIGPNTEYHESGRVCGCGNVPNKYKKYEIGLDYDDFYKQYEIPWTYKLGVRIYHS